ncbi:MAG: hypothetical protein K9K66_04410 [Desulfarculaceae bacterium]|nr:hypothetical protein [Desulfarculaceae bacterium]MCF8073286.1 hypothetical protein [Desulfarculaceae bacterium]MCF8100882.1 hypothetical protein [Desulfarculaceae bacterium]MCF8116662.1 hypothetical protein [Desulfarculaceae bacterium]
MCGLIDDAFDTISEPVRDMFPDPPEVEAPDYDSLISSVNEAGQRQAEILAEQARIQEEMLMAQLEMAEQQRQALAEEKEKATAEAAEEEAAKKKRLEMAAAGPMTLLTGGRGDPSTPSLLRPRAEA